MGKSLVIINPSANKGQTARLRERIAEAAKKHGAQLLETQMAGHATQLAHAAARDGYHRIIAVGGDGTLHEVANGILQSGRPVEMGIIAAGSGNDYANYALHLPRNLDQAIACAFNGRSVPVDMGCINDTYYQNSHGVGLDANVAVDVKEYLQPRSPFRGGILYTVGALRQIFLHYDQFPTLRIQIDDEPVQEQRLLLCATNIGPTAGGGYKFNPRANPFDGYLDLCMVRVMPQAKVLLALQLLRMGKHDLLREVSLRRFRRLKVKADQPVNAHIDGELLRGTEWEIEVLPGALRVVMPC